MNVGSNSSLQEYSRIFKNMWDTHTHTHAPAGVQTTLGSVWSLDGEKFIEFPQARLGKRKLSTGVLENLTQETACRALLKLNGQPPSGMSGTHHGAAAQLTRILPTGGL